MGLSYSPAEAEPLKVRTIVLALSLLLLAASPAQAQTSPIETINSVTHPEVRACRYFNPGLRAGFFACLHDAEGHRQGTAGHLWADYRRQARQFQRWLESLTPPIPYEANWDRVAECESGGIWSINTGNGYYGGLQFSLGTWRAYGGSGTPSDQSKADQVRVAERVRTTSSLGHWPRCGPLWYG